MESVGDGKVLIGSGAGRPAAANITGDSNVTITNGTNSIEVSSAATGGALTKISTATASTSASIDFTGLTSSYFLYIIRYSNLQPATDATTLILRTSTDGGSSYDSGASDYSWSLFQANESGSESGSADTADSSITVLGVAGGSDEMGSGANEMGCGNIYIFNPSAAKYSFVFCQGTYFNEATQLITNYSGGYRISAADVDAVQLLMDAGNISIGDFVLYGVSNT